MNGACQFLVTVQPSSGDASYLLLVGELTSAATVSHPIPSVQLINVQPLLREKSNFVARQLQYPVFVNSYRNRCQKAVDCTRGRWPKVVCTAAKFEV